VYLHGETASSWIRNPWNWTQSALSKVVVNVTKQLHTHAFSRQRLSIYVKYSAGDHSRMHQANLKFFNTVCRRQVHPKNWFMKCLGSGGRGKHERFQTSHDTIASWFRQINGKTSLRIGS